MKSLVRKFKSIWKFNYLYSHRSWKKYDKKKKKKYNLESIEITQEQQLSTLRIPQLNGVVDRKNQTLQEMSRAMLKEQSIPFEESGIYFHLSPKCNSTKIHYG